MCASYWFCDHKLRRSLLKTGKGWPRSHHVGALKASVPPLNFVSQHVGALKASVPPLDFVHVGALKASVPPLDFVWGH